jgi:hypothetical protein
MGAALKTPRTPGIGVIRRKKSTMPAPAPQGALRKSPALAGQSIFGFSQIACGVDWQVARQTGTAPLSTTTHARSLAKALSLVSRSPESEKSLAEANRLLIEYMTAVDTKASAAEASAQKKSAKPLNK